MIRAFVWELQLWSFSLAFFVLEV